MLNYGELSMRKKKPTLTEVAKHAGVSIATVSKVLSNTPYFTDETRDKVMASVDELGYVPNLAARALSSGKTHIITVVFPFVYDMFSADPLTLEILEGVESETTKRGYNLLLSTPRLSETGPEENFLNLLKSGYLEGVVALDNVPVTSILKHVRKSRIPAVSIGYGKHDYAVRSDDFSGGQQLMEHLVLLGHRNIAIVSVPPHMNLAVEERLAGFQQVIDEAGLDFSNLPVYEGDFSIESGNKVAQLILANHPETTAIVSVNDRMAIGVIQGIQARGLSVPADITVVGYDDILFAQLISPALTTINQRAHELGRVATQMLFDILANQKPEPVVLPTELVVRQSSAHPPKFA